MRIVIVADDIQKEGGNNEIIKHIKKALLDNATTLLLLTSSASPPSPTSSSLVQAKQNEEVKSLQVDIEYVIRAQYLPSYLPQKLKDLFRPVYLRNIARDTKRFTTANLIITTQPNSHCIQHENHIIYFQHHLKQYYDLFWYSFRQKKGIRKKAVFLILAAIVRASDRLYLTPNLRKSYVIVNSDTVGERLKKYNKHSSFDVIHPGCKIPEETKGKDYYQQSHTIKKTNDLSPPPPPPPLLLSFSRLSVMQKGIDIIIQTALNLPQYSFIIAGPYDPSIDSIRSSLTITPNVKFMVGEFSEEQKAELYRECNVFLAPYFEEDFGITPLEANAYGKPVIYCKDSGEIIRTQKHKQTGFMCDRTPSSIAEGIEYCLKNKENMKQACIENAKRYSWDNFEKSIVQYIIINRKMTQ
jgi:glycosyltransferase involved in cell wall biosynthesis